MNDQSAGTSGVEITGVVSGSPAAQARLKPGDRIVAMNGQRVFEYPDVLRIVASSAPGTELSLDILRGPFLMTRSTHLGLHRQVFPGQPAYQVATPASPWLHPFAPRPANPQRDAIMNSLYNSDF
jgi:membrane-associated protease RseP (regulator of RpoE activity)